MNTSFKYDKLMYYLKSEDRIPISFNDFNCPLGLKRKVKDGSIDQEKATKKIKKNLDQI